jgi:hypothetical protein
MAPIDKSSLMLLPGEIENDPKVFAREPLIIVARYLECFDRDGHQGRTVPQHVLEALAERFLLVMTEQLNSLDEAFGGRIARQRNRIVESARDYEVLFAFLGELERLQKRDKSDRDDTPYALAAERVAVLFKTSRSNVERIYKKSKVK